MIPLRLTLKNFMSYGDEPVCVDFAGIHLASLSGDNGNGKSALLDALTYALWGKTRASGSQASGDDDLVRLGADDMEVHLEFILGEDTYRTTRKRNKRTRNGDWQLHVLDGTGEWRPAGGSSMAETGRQLSRLLRMEYETFLNSAYIQQGRADEFTRQKPADRKRILGDILDLSRYDRLEEMARDCRGGCDLALKDLEGEIRHLEARAEEGAGAAHRLHLAEEAATNAAESRGQAADNHDKCAMELNGLDSKASRARDLEGRVREDERALAETDSQIASTTREITRSTELLNQAGAARADMDRLSANRRVVEECQAAVDRLNAAGHERASFQAAIDIARQELLRDIDRAASDVRRCEERSRQIVENDRRLADIGPKLAHFQQARQNRVTTQSALASAQAAFAEMAATSKRLKGEIAEVEEVVALLGEPKPACPVCASDLSGGRHQAVLLKQKHRLESLRERLTEVHREGSRVKRERDSLQAQMDTLEEQVRSEAALRAQTAELMSTRDRLCAENANQDRMAAHLETLKDRLDSSDYAQAERARLAAAESEITGLQSAADRYAEAAANVRQLTAQRVENRLADILRAERELAVHERELARLNSEREQRQSRVSDLRRAYDAALAELSGFEDARQMLAAAVASLRQAGAEYEAAAAQAARFRQTVDDCARAAEMLAARRSERDRLAKDKQAYTELAAAFSKRGVQAHIIDNALPEVQDEANRLLARLTDNAMQVSISTLRQARAGASQIETLDISITDDAGTRPYEMFSGGEAFRVNFAIRIALSRLLARRAGANLQTLILDEGFGTQDARGRERLIEAIEAVKDEFSLILVISHIEELKDAFPSRIEVTKGASGSQISFVQ